MNSVQEKYEEFVNKEDTLIRSVRTCEQAMSLLKDELVYKQRGETCQETVRGHLRMDSAVGRKAAEGDLFGAVGNDCSRLPIP
ncbi:hypothetical protein [Brevibacillus choshinensis]|uniref:hypothetical protein n=1 Tax=Brevibacillus choshinensis TaxID=54911 RepID=UPI001EEE5B4B|nr:hypothetical protein [Brevibacillus choshinensis]